MGVVAHVITPPDKVALRWRCPHEGVFQVVIGFRTEQVPIELDFFVAPALGENRLPAGNRIRTRTKEIRGSH